MGSSSVPPRRTGSCPTGNGTLAAGTGTDGEEYSARSVTGGVRRGVRLLALRAQALFDGVAVLRGRVMVLVEDGRIVAVDRSGAAPPPHAEVVELTDATLLPGLVDAHVHLAF